MSGLRNSLVTLIWNQYEWFETLSCDIDLESMKLVWDQYEWFETLSCDIDMGSIKMTSG